MRDVFITGAARTPIGAFRGRLSAHSAPELGSVAIKAAMQAAGITPDAVAEVIMGNVLTAGVGMAPARQAALLAGLPASVPALTINKVCGSGMKAITLARDALAAGQSETMVAGGMESMTRAPHLVRNLRAGGSLSEAEAEDHIFTDGLEAPCTRELMGQQAQTVADQYGITRAELDAATTESLLRAQRRIGEPADEIAPVGDVTTDELPAKLKAERIPTLKPAFSENGTLTAASASGLADGAAAVVLSSQPTADCVRIVGQANVAIPPVQFTAAPVYAIQQLLDKCGWRADEVGLYEINEAFASVPMLVQRQLEIDPARINAEGGSCALGHPLGCSGARLIVTLFHAMRRHGAERAIAAICIGGGEGYAVALERS